MLTQVRRVDQGKRITIRCARDRLHTRENRDGPIHNPFTRESEKRALIRSAVISPPAVSTSATRRGNERAMNFMASTNSPVDGPLINLI